MSNVTPQPKLPKLIVVVAFDRDEEGELQPAFGPAEQMSEERAVRTARCLADKHAGVIAWSREANPALGDYGPPTVLFQSGDVQEYGLGAGLNPLDRGDRFRRIAVFRAGEVWGSL